MMAPLGLLIQVGLLVAWYTVAPTLPAWVVFLPLILSAAGVAVLCVVIVVAAFIAAAAK